MLKAWRKRILWLALVPLVVSSNMRGDRDEMKVQPLESGIYHGAYADYPDNSTQQEMQKLTAQFQYLATKDIAWAVIQNDWDKGIHFPTEQVWIIHSLGKVPLIRLMPWSKKIRNQGPDPLYTFDNFINGYFDDELQKWAKAAKATSKPIMIEFAPEVNGKWFPWNGFWNGKNESQGYGDPDWPDGPEKYRDSYRHVVNVFKAAGATNITWVFHVDAQPKPEQEWNSMKYYYPGDEYIDWIGLSVFGAQIPGDYYAQFTEVVDPIWPELTALSATKPIALVETATIEARNNSKAKAEWISRAFEAIKQNHYSRLKGITWWNERSWITNGDNSMRIDSSPESLKSYQAEISDPIFVTEAKVSNFNPDNKKLIINNAYETFIVELRDNENAKDIFDHMSKGGIQGLQVIGQGNILTKLFTASYKMSETSGQQTLSFGCSRDSSGSRDKHSCKLFLYKAGKNYIPYKLQKDTSGKYWIVRNDNEYPETVSNLFNLFENYKPIKVPSEKDPDVGVTVPAGIKYLIPEDGDNLLQITCRGAESTHFCKFKIKIVD